MYIGPIGVARSSAQDDTRGRRRDAKWKEKLLVFLGPSSKIMKMCTYFFLKKKKKIGCSDREKLIAGVLKSFYLFILCCFHFPSTGIQFLCGTSLHLNTEYVARFLYGLSRR